MKHGGKVGECGCKQKIHAKIRKKKSLYIISKLCRLQCTFKYRTTLFLKMAGEGRFRYPIENTRYMVLNLQKDPSHIHHARCEIVSVIENLSPSIIHRTHPILFLQSSFCARTLSRP